MDIKILAICFLSLEKIEFWKTIGINLNQKTLNDIFILE